jgi:predicted Zn-ribbon and HTH transcriptional regulator
MVLKYPADNLIFTFHEKRLTQFSSFNLLEEEGINNHLHIKAAPSGRAVKGVGLRPLGCWDCGFEFRHGNLCLSL